MSFKILYVEDNDKTVEKVENSVHENREKMGSRSVELKAIKSPDLLEAELNEQYDLVLADVCFKDDADVEVKRLDDIIRIVREWSSINQLQKPLPIIAYTRREKNSIDYCLERRESLYDIWDKSSASPTYVAWRLTQIASEVARSRPDSLLLRLIRQMPDDTGSRWHDNVVEMTQGYSAGWTESDQIDRVTSSIGAIGMKLQVSSECKELWKTMQDWEPLSRAVSKNARGHARHVLNVFWLGYYLIHHPLLRDLFASSWASVSDNRENMGAVKDANPLEALSDCWFYAGLFHDVAGCIEKHSIISQKGSDLFRKFGKFVTSPDPATIETDAVEEAANDLLASIKPLRSVLTTAWNESLSKGKPDHGVIAGSHLVGLIPPSHKQNCFAREAARAMTVHNLISSIPSGSSLPIDWAKEPIIALLLLCDQIQTWDRERGTDLLKDQDGSERAELIGLQIERGDDGKILIEISIDYLGQRFLDYTPVVYDRVKARLENVLQDYPHKALSQLVAPWPFEILVNCSLNGKPINPLRFPSDAE